MQEFQYAQDILKEFLAPAIVNQVYHKAPWWAQIKKTSKGVYGKRIVLPVTLAFTEAVGARVANNYTLPSAQRNIYDQAYIYMKRNYGRIKVDGFLIESAKGKGGWVDVVTAESKGVSSAFAMDIDRQSMLDGRGRLAAVDGAIAAQVITVKDAGGIVGDTPKTKWFKKGQVLDIFDVDGTIHADSVQVSVVNAADDEITVVGDITAVTDTDLICREDTFSLTANNLGEMMGADGIVNTANRPGTADFEGIDRAANPEWQAYVKTSAGVLTELMIQEGLDAIEYRTDGEAPRFVLTTSTLRNKLIDIVLTDRMISTTKLVAGWEAIKYVGGNVTLTILTHKNAPTGYWYYIAMPHITFHSLKSITWDNKGGGILKPVANEDAYEAWFKMYGQIDSDMPNSGGKLTGVTIT